MACLGVSDGHTVHGDHRGRGVLALQFVAGRALPKVSLSRAFDTQHVGTHADMLPCTVSSAYEIAAKPDKGLFCECGELE